MVKKRGEAKTTARRRRTSEDLISKLPDDVLTHILSYLPTQTSVKTSVLSKRWSRLWLSVPNLDFHGCYISSSVRKAQFENFMDRFLSLNNARSVNLDFSSSVRQAQFENFSDRCLSLSIFRSVHMINFQLERDSEVSRVNAWLAAFGDRGAEKIDLTLREGDSCSLVYSLPDTFFIQSNLIKLELTTVTLKVPQSVCFPNLKEMVLKSVQLFDETSMKNLLFGSPVLCTLDMYLDQIDNVQTLHVCSFSLCSLILHIENENKHDYNVVIDSPNLTYLSLTDLSHSTYNIANAPLLASVYLRIMNAEVLLKLLTQITHVKEIHFAIFFTSDSPETLHANLPMLHNLIHLTVEIDIDEDEDFGDGGSLSRLLHCTPNIVSFSIDKVSRDDIYNWFEPYEVPPCFLSSIESVDFKWVGDGDDDLQMITYILKNAKILNKLSIHCHAHFLVNETKFLTTLLRLPKSSTNCQVEYKLIS